jgi:uncharacterized protein (DUF2336 family)
MDRRYEEHRAAVQRREEEVKTKEAAARRSAEEARRREEAAARHGEDARRKNEVATRRMREAEQLSSWCALGVPVHRLSVTVTMSHLTLESLCKSF